MSPSTQLYLLATLWILYALVHSLLASLRFKRIIRQRFPDSFPGYRLGYNLLAILLLVPPVWLLISYPGDLLWHWPEPVRWLADTLAILAILAFLWSIRIYDTGEFLGLSQLRKKTPSVDDQAPMSLSAPHRYVRHPWYFLGLVVIWTREMNAAFLITAVILTLYLWIGSRLEERKLLSCYGEQYRHYRKSVPGLFPLPWRYLSRKQAEDILRMGRGSI